MIKNLFSKMKKQSVKGETNPMQKEKLQVKQKIHAL